MSTIVLGAKTKLQIGQAVGSKIDITGVASGTESIAMSAQTGTRPVPGGRGVAAVQPGAFTAFDFTIACESNPVNDPVFRNATGKRMYFTFQPEGAGTGHAQYVGEAVATVQLTASLQQNSCVWTVRLAVDGAPVRTSQS